MSICLLINFMSHCSFYIIMMSRKKFSRNKQKKINQIYKIFFDLVLKNGYHKTSTNHVANAAKFSIGTIYKYFPKGKEDIVRKYFEKSMETMLDREDLIELSNKNTIEFLNNFIFDLFKNHKENKGYNIAFRSAIQSDKALLEAHKKGIFKIFKDLAQKLRMINKDFSVIPEEKLIEVFIFLYNLLNAIIFHHLSLMKLFDTDDKIIKYLSNIAGFSIKYLLNT